MRLNLLEIKDQFDKEGVLFSFSGSISQPVLSGFVKGMEVKLSNLEENTKTIRAVFELLIEMMQNVLNYSYDSIHLGDGAYESKGIIVFGKNYELDKYYIMSGNRVAKDKVEKIRESIINLNSLDKDELRKLYRERRRSGSNGHSRGAGLGMIDLARKSSQPIDFSFDHIDQDTAFFSLQVTI